MVRKLSRGAIIRGSGRRGSLDVENVDEDQLTLAVAAVEALRRGGAGIGRPGTDRIELVGAFPELVHWALPEALGLSPGIVHHHSAGRVGLASAVPAASAPDSQGSSLLIAADLNLSSKSGPHNAADGAAALAFLFEETPGATLRVWRPSAGTTSADPHEAARISLGATEEQLRGLPIHVLQAPGIPMEVLRVKGSHPGSSPLELETLPDSYEGVGFPQSVGPAMELRALCEAAQRGEIAVLATPTPNAPAALFVATSDGETRWRGAWKGRPHSEGPKGSREPGVEPPDLAAVSEGAYVPYARYRENLPGRWRLAADRCGACGHFTFPRRARCRHCAASDRLEAVELPREGLIVEAVTKVHPGAQPTEFDPYVESEGSYSVVLARAGPEVRLTLQFAGPPPEIAIGDRVDTELRRLYAMEGEWRYGLKATLPHAE
ncbi:MAG: zinc ribbon domain-containing protein [Thermoplasmata archaeon]|nr:zinc ribbon domain-containing protein [Thermoplasmata archaeon]